MSVEAVVDTHTHTYTFIDQLLEVFVTLHQRVRNRPVKGSNGHFLRLAVVLTQSTESNSFFSVVTFIICIFQDSVFYTVATEKHMEVKQKMPIIEIIRHRYNYERRQAEDLCFVDIIIFLFLTRVFI
jgi:hypothetical protein